MTEKCTYCDSMRECLLAEQRYGDELRARAIAAEKRIAAAEELLRQVESPLCYAIGLYFEAAGKERL